MEHTVLTNAKIAHQFWNTNSSIIRQMAHWPSAGRWHQEFTWERIGDQHWEIFSSVVDWAKHDPHTLSLLDWGCGGGCNVVAFSRRFGEIWGVDISRDTLQCCSQVARMHQIGFRAVYHDLIRFPSYDLPMTFDAFLCTGVLMYAPSREYNLRLLSFANTRLRLGGMAMFHITEQQSETQTHYEDYPLDYITYTEDEFTGMLYDIGFDVRLVKRQSYHNNLFVVCEKV